MSDQRASRSINLRCGAQPVKVIGSHLQAYRLFVQWLLVWVTAQAPLPSKLLLLSLPQAAASASVSIQCTPVGCVHSLMANARQIGKVSEWLGSVSLKASDHVAEHVAVQHFSR